MFEPGRCFELFYFGGTELEAHIIFAEFSQLLRQKNKLLRNKEKVFEVEYPTEYNMPEGEKPKYIRLCKMRGKKEGFEIEAISSFILLCVNTDFHFS